MLIAAALAGAGPARGQAARDSLLITPTTQGMVRLSETGVTLEIAYASVNSPTRLTVTHEDGQGYTLSAVSAGGIPLDRFEMPLIVTLDTGGTWLIGWPQTFDTAVPADPWLVVFDAHGIYAQPTAGAQPESILFLGPVEHYTPDLLDTTQPAGFAASEPAERAILKTAPDGTITALPTAARSGRYRDRFGPEDLRNPGGFMLLGLAQSDQLPALARALRSTIPDDPDLPAPGDAFTPLRLLLPFNCTQDWIVSWGYHHATAQNRFAVDFATAAPVQPVYAAHAGTAYLKRYGTADHLIDTGIAARVIAADGNTSTLYGHLDEAATLAFWRLDHLPDFEWVEVGRTAPGDVIGVMGSTGYATGPHIHFVLWSWDQSLYQPVPLGPLGEFVRGQIIAGARRSGCDLYRQ